MYTILLRTKTDFNDWLKQCRNYDMDFDPMLMPSHLPCWVTYIETESNGYPSIEYEALFIENLKHMIEQLKE
jgi:hypothetical protein